jgi:hypothetical protein
MCTASGSGTCAGRNRRPSSRRCLYEWVKTTNGTINLTPHEFGAIARPMVEALWQKTKGQKPTMQELAGTLYDALDAAGAEVTISKPAGHDSTP